MPKIGVVGPTSSVERILDVAEKMNVQIDFIPFTYYKTHETIEIVQANLNKVDGWLFSGPAPKMITEHLLVNHPVVGNCFQVGASLYRSLIQMSYKAQNFKLRVSIDVTMNDDIDSALQEVDMSKEDIYIKFYDSNFSVSEIIDYHYNLFKSKKIDGVITSLHFVYEALKELNVPVLRNTPTKMEIKLAIQIIEEKINTHYFKNTQIGIAVLQVDLLNQIKNMTKSHYQIQMLELEIKRVLLQLNERLDGYIIEKGNGGYEIFSSRGAVIRELEFFKETLNQISMLTDSLISVGIGFGQTFYAAEINAYRAVNHAKGKACNQIVIQDGNVLIEDAGSEHCLHYEIATQDGELLKKLNLAGVSIKIYQKTVSIISSQVQN